MHIKTLFVAKKKPDQQVNGTGFVKKEMMFPRKQENNRRITGE
ncbi:hypothetical protein ACSAZL_09175 [Methanosarcina sp. T3]